MLFGQSRNSLSLSSASVPPGGSVVLALTLASDPASQPAGIQWDLAYSPTEITAINVYAGSALTGAGKSIQCAARSGSTTCLGVGLNTKVIASGVVATVELAVSTKARNKVSISVNNALGASVDADAIPISSTGGTVTVRRSLRSTRPVLLQGADTGGGQLAAGAIVPDRSATGFQAHAADHLDPAAYTSFSFCGGLEQERALDAGYGHIPADLSGDVTFTAWIRTSNASGQEEVFSAHDIAGGAGYSLATTPSGLLALRFGTGRPEITDSTRIDDGHWHHIAVVVTSEDVRFYIDGALSSANPNSVWIDAGPIHRDAFPFSGTLDELRVYRTALSAGAVLDLSGNPPKTECLPLR
jgi:hypothetical protein